MSDSAELNYEISDSLAIGEALLRQRLQNGFKLMENGAAISGYVTQAEYQLFLATPPLENKLDKPWFWQNIFQGTDNWFYYPLHWANPGLRTDSTLLPITGLPARYAEAFCQWLAWFDNQRPNRYRLPTPEEAVCYPTEPTNLAAWCSELSKLELDGEPQVAGAVELVGLSAETNQLIRHKLTNLPELPRQIAQPGKLDFIQALLKSTLYNVVVTHAQGLEIITGLEFEKCRYLYIDLAYATAYFKPRPNNQPYHYHTFQRMLALAEPFDKICKLLEARKLAEAAVETQLLRQPTGNSRTSCRANLLYQLIEARRAIENQDIFATRRAGLNYALAYANYALDGLQKLEQTGENPVKSSAKMKQQAADLYFAARVPIERRDNDFPSWEGLRIVRETAK